MAEEKEKRKPLAEYEYPPYFTYTQIRFKGDPEYNLIGKPVTPKDGYEKVSGTAMYTTDVKLPGMLYVLAYTSPYAHAKAKNIDVSEASKTPGVISILKHGDPEVALEGSPEGRWAYGRPWELYLMSSEAVWEGMPVAVAVCAESLEAAYEALRRVKIDWEELPFVIDQKEALKPDAPIAKYYLGQNDNIFRRPPFPPGMPGPTFGKYVKGDVEEGFKQADRIIEFEIRCAPQSLGGTEQWAYVAWLHGGKFDAWVRQHHTFEGALLAPTLLGLSLSDIKVHYLYHGASFGGTNHCGCSYHACALASIFAKRTGRPVKALSPWINHSGMVCEEFGYYKFKVGFKNDGTITAVQVLTNVCYVPGSGVPGSEKLVEATSIKNFYLEDVVSILNVAPQTCYRHGTYETIAFSEVFSRVAAELGMDPTEVALKNDGCSGKPMHPDMDEEKKHLGRLPRDSLKECIEAGKEAIGWTKKWHAPGARKLPNGKYHGLGFTWCMNWRSSHHGVPGMHGGHASAVIKRDGSVIIMGLRSCIGVDEKSTYCQIFAEESGLPYDAVEIDTHEPSQGASLFIPGGSGGLSVNSSYMKALGIKVKQKILEVAAIHFGRAPQELDVRNGVVYEKANPNNKVSVAELASRYEREFAETLSATGAEYFIRIDMRGAFGEKEWPKWGRQVAFVEIEVDPETGEIQIDKMVVVHDAGRVMNPNGYAGQIYGGAHMGVERQRLLEYFYDPNTGVKLNDSYENFPALTMADMFPVDCIGVETGLAGTPYGHFGVGENVACLVRDVLRDAVYNAIGKWIDEDPITPEKVLRALGKV